MISPNLKYIISVGDCNDKGLFIWNFDNCKKIASNKRNKETKAATFTQDGKFLVTGGQHHIKY